VTVDHIIDGPHIFVASTGSLVPLIIPESSSDKDIGMINNLFEINCVENGKVLLIHN
jgi:hypothetical protein